MPYDPMCYMLAEYFAPDASKEVKVVLAQAIQDAVELVLDEDEQAAKAGFG